MLRQARTRQAAGRCPTQEEEEEEEEEEGRASPLDRRAAAVRSTILDPSLSFSIPPSTQVAPQRDSVSSGHGRGQENALPERSQAGTSRVPLFVTATKTEHMLSGSPPVKAFPPRPSCFRAGSWPRVSGTAPASALYSKSRSWRCVSWRCPGEGAAQAVEREREELHAAAPSQPTRSQSQTLVSFSSHPPDRTRSRPFGRTIGNGLDV